MRIVLDYTFLKGLHIMPGLILLPQRESDEIVRSDKLFEHCAKIDEAARNRMELIVPELAKAVRRDRTAESRKPNGMGAADERLQGTGRGSCEV